MNSNPSAGKPNSKFSEAHGAPAFQFETSDHQKCAPIRGDDRIDLRPCTGQNPMHVRTRGRHCGQNSGFIIDLWCSSRGKQRCGTGLGFSDLSKGSCFGTGKPIDLRAGFRSCPHFQASRGSFRHAGLVSGRPPGDASSRCGRSRAEARQLQFLSSTHRNRRPGQCGHCGAFYRLHHSADRGVPVGTAVVRSTSVRTLSKHHE